MTQQIDRAGNVRGEIVGYSLFDADSGSLGLNYTLSVHEFYDYSTGEWTDWREADVVVDGTVWILKSNSKGGGPNESGIKSLVEHGGWDARIESLADGSWQPRPIQVKVEPDDYAASKGKLGLFRGNWINDYDSKPGGGGISEDRAKELSRLYGSKIRAVAGNVQRNTAAPAGKPSMPSMPDQKPSAMDNADIPF